jgi:hypothetical protein
MRLFVLFNSGGTEELFNVSPEQAAQFVDTYPKTHIFVMEETNAP